MSTKLKILQITNRIPYPLNDGGNIATYNVTKFLHSFGHKVTLACLNTNKHFQDPGVVKNITSEIYTTDINTDVTIKGLLTGILKSTPYNIERFYSKEFESKLEEILSQEKFDIIQLEGIYLSVYLDVIRNNSTSPVILRSHNIEHMIWKRLIEKEKNILKKIYLHNLSAKIKNFELRNLHNFDGIVAITQNDEAFYKENGFKGLLTTINAGVDFDLYKKTSVSPVKNTLCFLGSMEWMPNVQGIKWFIDEVWNKLKKDIPEIELHIAGKNPPEDLMKLNIPGITMHGMIEDGIAFLNKYDLVIVPLLSGGGMRLKVIEAMALGKCIISTTIGCEGIEVKHSENILIADTPEEFSSAIRFIMNDKELQDSIGRNAYELAYKKYSWEKLVREFENFYLESIEKNKNK